jgi:hypothetical protein
MFRKMDELTEASDDLKKNKVKNLRPRLKQWIYARSVDSSDLKFAEPETEQAVSQILKYVEDAENGTFTPSRERDEPSLGLGNPEHLGRTRGLGKLTTWEKGFKEYITMYKKHDRCRKDDLEVKVKDIVEKVVSEQGLFVELWTQMVPLGELVVIGNPPDVPSSQGSNATTTAVDRIREPTSCTLLVPMGRGDTMLEVATGVAHPPVDLCHHLELPRDYTRVEVHTVKPEYMRHKIDHPTPEGLVHLGEVMKQFIL